jgi:cell division initiation protein
MKLSSADIRQQEFPGQFRGFNKTEVRAFLEIAADVVDSLNENLAEAERRLAASKDETERLQSALRAKDQAIDELKHKLVAATEAVDVKMQAAMTIETARNEAELILKNARTRLRELESEIELLSKKRAKMMELFRTYLESQLAALPESEVGAEPDPVTVEKTVDPQKEDRKQQVIEDLNSLVTQKTAMFRKADFHKMLGDDAEKRSDELIDKIFSDIHKKQSE